MFVNSLQVKEEFKSEAKEASESGICADRSFDKEVTIVLGRARLLLRV